MKDILIIKEDFFSNGFTGEYLTKGEIIAILVVSLAVIIGFYLLRSFGLYKMSKKAQMKNNFMCFLPFVWLYRATELSGKQVFFGNKIKRLPLLFFIIFTVCELTLLVMNFLLYFPLIGYYLSGGSFCYSESYNLAMQEGFVPYFCGEFSSPFFVGSDIVYPYQNISSMAKAIYVLSLISNIFEIIRYIVVLDMAFALFRKYWPKHYILAGILSIFGLFPIFVFAKRNAEPVDYMEYLKRNFPNRFYYGGQNPYQNGGNYQNNNNAGEPFSDFNKTDKEKNNDDPFEEFSNKSNSYKDDK